MNSSANGRAQLHRHSVNSPPISIHMLRIAKATGLSPERLSHLRWKDYDFEMHRLTLSTTPKLTVYLSTELDAAICKCYESQFKRHNAAPKLGAKIFES